MVSFSLLASSAFVALASAYAYPGACSGICNDSHDPSLIIDSAGTYWRFSTGNKISVYSAPALVGPWTHRGSALPQGSSINLPGKDDLWAPDVIKVGNTYYLFYSVSTFGSQDSAIGVATSTTLEPGSWTDHGSSGVASKSGKPYNAIDPAVTKVGNDYYMTFGSFWKDIYQVKMANPPLKTASGVSSSQVSYDPVTTAEEGSFLYQYGSYWYLFYSKGQCCNYVPTKPAPGKEYKIMVCRSTSATGPFVDESGEKCTSGGGTPVLESHGWLYGPGGQGVMTDPKEGPVLYYHYVDTRIGYADGQKKLGWNKLDFSSGWPVAL
ncbi:hypothetical protein TD95_003934 [Thielaviopsis punctulata]|uniref:Arabinan endo-1,5-alpha-L-arabinosidase n=1 Tax=Thielaviopsis punctulata TaxID=72032 RepID=A0A0F4ZD74_9PEZI|nr:hypothetical protein TD95_003934 [Thielaviopsis punctulata]